jgi:hypothetical protein
MSERVFDAVASDGWHGTAREVDPPALVWLNLALVFPPSRVGSGATPLRVLAYGLDNGEVVPAELYRWIQVRTGEWWGRVRATAHSSNKRMDFDLDGLAVPAAALRPHDDG